MACEPKAGEDEVRGVAQVTGVTYDECMAGRVEVPCEKRGVVALVDRTCLPVAASC